MYLFSQIPEQIQVVLLEATLYCQVLQDFLDLHKDDLETTMSKRLAVLDYLLVSQDRTGLVLLSDYHCSSKQRVN